MSIVTRSLKFFSRNHRRALSWLSILIPPDEGKKERSDLLGTLIVTEDVGPITIQIHEKGMLIIANSAILAGDQFAIKLNSGIAFDRVEIKKAVEYREQKEGKGKA